MSSDRNLLALQLNVQRQ